MRSREHRKTSRLCSSEGFVMPRGATRSFNERIFCSSFNEKMDNQLMWQSHSLTSSLWYGSTSLPPAELAAVTYEGNGRSWSVLYILVYRLCVYIALVKLIHKTLIPASTLPQVSLLIHQSFHWLCRIVYPQRPPCLTCYQFDKLCLMLLLLLQNGLMFLLIFPCFFLSFWRMLQTRLIFTVYIWFDFWYSMICVKYKATALF